MSHAAIACAAAMLVCAFGIACGADADDDAPTPALSAAEREATQDAAARATIGAGYGDPPEKSATMPTATAVPMAAACPGPAGVCNLAKSLRDGIANGAGLQDTVSFAPIEAECRADILALAPRCTAETAGDVRSGFSVLAGEGRFEFVDQATFETLVESQISSLRDAVGVDVVARATIASIGCAADYPSTGECGEINAIAFRLDAGPPPGTVIMFIFQVDPETGAPGLFAFRTGMIGYEHAIHGGIESLGLGTLGLPNTLWFVLWRG